MVELCFLTELWNVWKREASQITVIPNIYALCTYGKNVEEANAVNVCMFVKDGKTGKYQDMLMQ